MTNTTNSQNRLQLLVSVSVTCETFSGFLLNLFRPCFIHGPPNAPSQDVPALIGPAGGPHLCQGPDLLSALPSFFLYDRQHFFFISSLFWQDVQLHGRWLVLRRSREHSPHRLHGNRLLDAVSPLQQLHAPGPVAVLRSWEVHDTHRQYW